METISDVVLSKGAENGEMSYNPTCFKCENVFCYLRSGGDEINEVGICMAEDLMQYPFDPTECPARLKYEEMLKKWDKNE